MSELRDNESISAKALMFTILTAARTGETTGAIWSEIDVDAKLWVLPPPSAIKGLIPRSAQIWEHLLDCRQTLRCSRRDLRMSSSSWSPSAWRLGTCPELAGVGSISPSTGVIPRPHVLVGVKDLNLDPFVHSTMQWPDKTE